MTATSDRRSDLDDDPVEPAWDERPIFGKSRGLPWWGAVLLAFGLAAVAAVIDVQRQDTLGVIFQGAYILGCVAAICLVRRATLFGPMVQPPLVFAVTAVGALATLAPSGQGSGLKQLLFAVALPLTSNFPTMAVTTGVTVAIGVARLFLQRDPDPVVRESAARKRPEADDEPRADRRPAAAAGERRPERERPAREPARDRAPREGARPKAARDGERDPERRPRDPNRKPPVRGPRPQDR